MTMISLTSAKLCFLPYCLVILLFVSAPNWVAFPSATSTSDTEAKALLKWKASLFPNQALNNLTWYDPLTHNINATNSSSTNPKPRTSPCTWTGVSCNAAGSVSKLNLSTCGIQGWGTNEDLIISILGHRNAAQRKVIRQTYAEAYGEDLLKELEKELTSDFERSILLWTLDPAERDAFLANEATKKWTKSNQVLAEIACSRSSHELLMARQAYHSRYKKSLEEDVAHHTTGDFRKLLAPLVSSYRYEGDEVNLTLAKSEAKLLHEKISDKAYNDEDIIRILATRSKAQINATLNHYKNEFGNDINKDLKADPKDEYLAILRATIKCLVRPEKYFEKSLRLAINKRGTDEGALSRVVTTRAEVDMKLIKEQYHKRNSVTLDQDIKKDTTGDYEKMLLALVGHEDA